MDTDELKKIMPESAEQLSEHSVRFLLSAPSGSRPRIYGIVNGVNGIHQVGSTETLDRWSWAALWTTNTTITDMIRRA